MKQINQYIFNLYHFILNVRDTMEYAINRDHDIKLFENRKRVLNEELLEGHAFGNFLKNNGENGEKLRERVQNFINDYYGDESTILMANGDKVRVDHTQNIHIFEGVIELSDTLRDILAQYVAVSKQKKEDETLITNLVILDERMFRVVFTMLVMQEFEKSFFEFQKMMSESQGQPTPQSNYIVQNELFKMSKFIRDSRAHIHITDNETLDLLDDTIKVIEMTEGRRDRPSEKPFKDIFEDINRRLSDYVNKIEPQWKLAYETGVKEIIADSQNNAAQQQETAEDKNLN